MTVNLGEPSITMIWRDKKVRHKCRARKNAGLIAMLYAQIDG